MLKKICSIFLWSTSYITKAAYQNIRCAIKSSIWLTITPQKWKHLHYSPSLLSSTYSKNFKFHHHNLIIWTLIKNLYTFQILKITTTFLWLKNYRRWGWLDSNKYSTSKSYKVTCPLDQEHNNSSLKNIIPKKKIKIKINEGDDWYTSEVIHHKLEKPWKKLYLVEHQKFIRKSAVFKFKRNT